MILSIFLREHTLPQLVYLSTYDWITLLTHRTIIGIWWKTIESSRNTCINCDKVCGKVRTHRLFGDHKLNLINRKFITWSMRNNEFNVKNQLKIMDFEWITSSSFKNRSRHWQVIIRKSIITFESCLWRRLSYLDNIDGQIHWTWDLSILEIWYMLNHFGWLYVDY